MTVKNEWKIRKERVKRLGKDRKKRYERKGKKIRS